MNKFLQKLAKIFLGLSMAAGVGVAIGAGRKDASPAHATDKTFSTVGGSAGSYKLQNSSSDYWQTDAGSNETASPSRGLAWSKKAATLTYTPSANVTALSLVGSSNQAGQTIKYKIGTGSAVTVGTMTKENNKTYTFSNFSCSSGTQITINITAGGKSTWVKSITITESSGPTQLPAPGQPTYNSSTQRLTWSAVSNASSYEYTTNGGSSWTAVTNSSSRYHDVSGWTDNTSYTVALRAVGDGTNYSTSAAGTALTFTKVGTPVYASVTVTGGSLQGATKGTAYIQCSAAATGTNLPASPTFTWYVTATNSYATTTSVADKASINTTGKVTFLDNCTVYVWALAPDGSIYNTSGYAATASGLADPKGSEGNPYTVAEARSIATTTANNTHVTGIIYEVSSYNSTYNSLTYWISDSGSGSSSNKDGLQIYSGKGLNGADFSGTSDLTVGSTVVVQGDLKIYQTTTYELDKNSVIKSITLPKAVSSIAVKTAPTKTTYDAGEYFAPAGLVITVTYSDATTEDVAYSGNESKFTFTPTTSTALTTSNLSVTIAYGGQSTSQAITVNAVPVVISVTVSPSSASINIGATTSLSATVEVEGGAAQTVSWSTSDGSVATVANGVVTGVAAGTATITATSTVNNEKSGSATITVVDPTDTKIGTYALVKDVSLLGDGDWIVITNIAGTYGMGEQGSNSYRSQVAVTLTGSDIVISNTLNTSLKAAKLSVKNSHFEIKTDEGYLYANSGSSNNVGSRATNSDANGEWVFTINSSSGNATCIAQGSNSRKSFRYNATNSRFSCYAVDNQMADIHIYKKLPETAAVSLTSNKEVLTSIGDTATLTAKAYSDSGKTKEIAGLTNTDFAFTSGDTNILTVSESGVVTAVDTGETTITVSRNNCSASVTIRVVYLTIDLVNGAADLETGSSGTFSFTWSSDSLKPVSPTITWSSSNSTSISVTAATGAYTAGSAGTNSTITVTATAGGYTYTATRVFDVVSTLVVPTHISVTESSGVVAYVGSNVSLHISVLGVGDVPATNQNVTCTSSNSDVLTVTNAGVISPKARGVATITIVDQGEFCTPVEISVRVRNKVLGDDSVIGTFDFTGYTVTDKTMIDWYTEGTSAYSSAEFTGTYQAADGGYIRFGSGSGNGAITVSYSSAIVKKVVVSAKLYGSDEQDCGIDGAVGVGSFNASDFGDITYTFNSPVDEFTFGTHVSKKRLYVESIIIYTDKADISSETNPQALYSFEETNMHLDDYNRNLGYCKDNEHHYYSTAKSAFNALTKDQRDMYISNEAFADGWARLSAWATANGESLNASNQLAARPGISHLVNIIGENTNTVAIIVIISMVSVTAIGGYFFLRKRKENI